MGKAVLFEHLKACAHSTKNFTNGVVAEMAQSVADALTEMESAKADKSGAVSVTIPVTGWKSDATSGYPQYYDILVPGATTRDRATITISPAGLGLAAACGMCPTSETLAGIIRLRASGIPNAEILAEYWIDYGKER